RDLADGFINNKRESYKFKFQKIFDQEAKQDVIFDSIAKPVAECVLAGYNGTIFAYGQTGSGKTFTITGGAERYSDRGIIPRTLSYIFDQLQKDSSKVYTTHVSYLEIYNECGYDLLDPRHEASKMEDLPKVTIMEDSDQNIHLKNLSLQQATNEEEALNLLFLGDTNRMIAETPMNQASSRSHCIFTIHISSKEPGSATIRRSKLHLVDLAGSERVAKTGIGGHLLTEAKYINLSLHYLEQVIIALAEKNRSHIPYRNSMMTSVLRDSLGGNCMTTMIAMLAMDKRNIDESISTCRFAQRVALIKNEAVLNEEIDPRLMIIQLKKEIQDLKDELALVTGKQRKSELSQEELLQLDELIETFLKDNDPDSSLDVGADMRKIKYCFVHMKVFFLNGDENQIINHPMSSGKKLLSQDISEEKSSNEELEKLKGLLQQRDNEISILCGGKRGKMSLGCQEAFEIFKRDHADSITIEDNKQLLKQRWGVLNGWKYATTSLIFDILNSNYLHFISFTDHLKGKIIQRQIQRAALGKILSRINLCSDVCWKICNTLSSSHISYKTVYSRFKGLKVEIEHLQFLMEKVKMKLQKDFEVWWSEEAEKFQALGYENKQTYKVDRLSLISRKSRNFTEVVRKHSSTSIPLTGDSQADADILAFIKARQNILQKKGKSCQEIESQTKICSTSF
uniref:Kinesin-like protein n=1 Tax=Serinus canaria TaxID=9135 RepID=A0A8C9NBJ2_SERCA